MFEMLSLLLQSVGLPWLRRSWIAAVDYKCVECMTGNFAQRFRLPSWLLLHLWCWWVVAVRGVEDDE